MKLTWFAGATIRIHIGGQVLVAGSGEAPGWVDQRELVAGADRVFEPTDADIPAVDPERWRRKRPVRPLAEAGPAGADIVRLAPGILLVDVPGEPALVLAGAPDLPPTGRWADDAVIVLFGAGEAITAAASVLLDIGAPRLLALAADDAAVDLAVAALREHLDGTALVSLEPGMAVEV